MKRLTLDEKDARILSKARSIAGTRASDDVEEIEALVHEISHMFLLTGSVEVGKSSFPHTALEKAYEDKVSDLVNTKYGMSGFHRSRHECITSALTLLTMRNLDVEGIHGQESEIYISAVSNMDLGGNSPSFRGSRKNRERFVDTHLGRALEAKVNQDRAKILSDILLS